MYSVRIQENTEQKKLRIWTLHVVEVYLSVGRLENNKRIRKVLYCTYMYIVIYMMYIVIFGTINSR